MVIFGIDTEVIPILRKVLIFFFACLCAASVAQGAAELLLKNGRVLRGTDVERQGSSYHLEMADGRTVAVPMSVVREVRLLGDRGAAPADAGAGNDAASDPRGRGAPDRRVTEDTRTRPPSGIRTDSNAETIAGHEAPSPPESVLPPAAPQSRSAGEWVPESDWPTENWATANEPKGGTEWGFAASPAWEPEPAFTEEDGVTNFNPSRWMKTPNSTWKPEDGFKRRKTSFTLASRRPVSARLGLPPNLDVASWYGERFQGRDTASGVPYDMEAFTAAHPDLPFGTLVMVTHLNSGRSVIVEINDRGPSVPGRTINLSRASAKAIGMLDQGLAAVQVQTIPGVERSAAPGS